jgi:hypothetical protein
VPPQLARATGCSAGELISLTRRLQTLRSEILDSTRAASDSH